MDALSLFTGIGGFDLAFERAGVTIAQQCEIDPRCRELLGKRFPGTQCLEDVRDVRTTSADIICGGFPCQDISTAGKRAGLAGERSGLWHEFARIIGTAHPEWVVVENVAGLLSSNQGRDMGTILGALGDLGYGWAYRVLDAQFFGVPQRRKRVFIVGHRGDARRACEALLEPEGGCWNPPTRSQKGEDLAGTLAARTLGGGYLGTDEACANHVIATTLTRKGPAQLDDNAVGQLVVAAYNNVRTFAKDGEVDEYYKPTDISNALHVSHSNKRVTVVQAGARKLMPIECERLQGFPDNWTEGFPDTTRYRMLGNAVAVPVVEWIARRLVDA